MNDAPGKFLYPSVTVRVHSTFGLGMTGDRQGSPIASLQLLWILLRFYGRVVWETSR